MRHRICITFVFSLLATHGVIGQPPQVESILQAAAEGNEAAWMAGIQAWSLEDSIASPLANPWSAISLPLDERPGWMQQPTEALMWLSRLTMPTHLFATSGPLSQPSSERLENPRQTKSSPKAWLFVAITSFLACMLFLVWDWKDTMQKPDFWSPTLESLDARLRGKSSADWHYPWEALHLDLGMIPSKDLSPTLDKYNLTSSEREVVVALLQGWSAEEIAEKMACTTSHVYNLRSQLRKKMNLNAEENLERRLRREGNT